MSLTPFWQQQVDPFYGGTRTIGAGIARIPMMRAMAANRAAQGQFYTAHAEQERQAAELERQKGIAAANETQEGSDFADSASQALGVFSDATAAPEIRKSAATDLMRKAGRLAAKDPDKAMQIFDHLVQRMQASPTDLTQQFEANNPGKLVTGSDVLTDQQLQAAQAAKIAQETRPPAGQLSSRVITIKHPSVDARPAVPGPTHWFKPNEPGTPAVPGTPEWTEEIKGPTDGSQTALTQFSQDPRLGPVLNQILPGTQTETSSQNDQPGAAIPPQAVQSGPFKVGRFVVSPVGGATTSTQTQSAAPAAPDPIVPPDEREAAAFESAKQIVSQGSAKPTSTSNASGVSMEDVAQQLLARHNYLEQQLRGGGLNADDYRKAYNEYMGIKQQLQNQVAPANPPAAAIDPVAPQISPQVFKLLGGYANVPSQ